MMLSGDKAMTRKKLGTIAGVAAAAVYKDLGGSGVWVVPLGVGVRVPQVAAVLDTYGDQMAADALYRTMAIDGGPDGLAATPAPFRAAFEVFRAVYLAFLPGVTAAEDAARVAANAAAHQPLPDSGVYKRVGAQRVWGPSDRVDLLKRA